MKVYTKEMFLIAAEKCEVSMIDAEHIMKYIDEYVTPIQLPTDEEIHLNSPYESNSGPDVFNSDYDIGYHNGWKAGAKYVINKIKGGQDE